MNIGSISSASAHAATRTAVPGSAATSASSRDTTAVTQLANGSTVTTVRGPRTDVISVTTTTGASSNGLVNTTA